MNERRIKILLGKVGLDGHDIGIKTISKFLRDTGMEVVYLGAFNTPAGIASSAVQEDVDIIGLSFLGGAHIFYVPIVLKELKERGRDDIPLIVGGVIPKQDHQHLKTLGVKEVFEPGSRIEDILKYIQTVIRGDSQDHPQENP